MKFKSIQFSVAALAGASVLAVVVALVLYALFSGARTQALVQQRTQSLLERVIEQRLTELAQAQVSREELSNLVRETTAQNPKLLDSYLGWEANAFDASDDIYAGPKGNGYDGSGRFLPCWFRNADGSLGVDAIGYRESEQPLPTGVRAGEYYLCPKERKRACVIDPAPYEVGGKRVMLSSFTVPILVKGEFRGIAEAAQALESITQAVSVINEMNTRIASTAEEQSAVAEDINRNVSTIDQVANQEAGGADEASQASAELTKLAEQQRRLINQFRV